MCNGYPCLWDHKDFKGKTLTQRGRKLRLRQDFVFHACEENFFFDNKHTIGSAELMAKTIETMHCYVLHGGFTPPMHEIITATTLDIVEVGLSLIRKQLRVSSLRR